MKPLRDPEGHEAKSLTFASQFAGKDILEIGCGDGWLTWQYAGSAGNVFGVDPSFPDLQNARESKSGVATNVWLATSMGEKLPFPDDVFDIAIYTNSL